MSGDYIAIELPRGTGNALKAKLGPSGETFMDDDVDVEYLVERIEKALMGTEPGPVDEHVMGMLTELMEHVYDRIAYQTEERSKLPKEKHFEHGLRQGKKLAYEDIGQRLLAIEQAVNEKRRNR